MTIDYTKPPQYPPPPPPNPPIQPGPPPPQKSACGKIAAIGCSVLLILGVLFIAGIVVFVFGLIKSTDVYKEALRRAQSNPEVQALLGTPIEAKLWVSGNVNVKNNTGEANISIPIKGPKGSATIHAVATRSNDQWRYESLNVNPADTSKPPINLLQ